MSEEKDKPTVVKFKVTIPTKETVLDSLRRMFPLLEVEVEADEGAQEAPTIYCSVTGSARQPDVCPTDCPGRGTTRCPLKGD